VGLLSACQNIQPPLLTNGSGLVPVQATQVLTIERNGESLSTTLVLALSDTETTIVALSPIGHRLFSIICTGEGLVLQQATQDLQLPAEHIVSMMQYVYWPESRLQAASTGKWHLESDENTRNLLYKSRLITKFELSDWQMWHAIKWPRDVQITSYLLDMTLNIRTVDLQPL
tara:strand:+ start:11921 stop:12436 length:516 start_codon:yes stop_codon:yes gene_type:complete